MQHNTSDYQGSHKSDLTATFTFQAWALAYEHLAWTSVGLDWLPLSTHVKPVVPLQEGEAGVQTGGKKQIVRQ